VNIYKHSFGYLFFLFLSLFALLILKAYPIVSLLSAELVLLFYMAIRLKGKTSFIILIFPLIVYFLSCNYALPYTELGDAFGYFPSADYVWDNYVVGNGSLTDLFEKGWVYFGFYFHHFGAWPSIWLTEHFFLENASSSVYYLSQTYYLLILLYTLLYFSDRWNVFSEKVQKSIFIFIILSPTFFELGVAVTRHYFTFFSVFLYYLAFDGLLKKFTFEKFIALIFSIIFLLIGKPAYLLAITLYSGLILYSRFTKLQRLISFFIVSSVSIILIPFVFDVFIRYGKLLMEGSSSLSFPVFLIVPLKYILAIFSPFPWYKFDYHFFVYGGNIYFFIGHILSSIFGLWVLFRLVLYLKSILSISPEIKSVTIYGIIMSSTVIFGATGFHGYLSVFFPFFAPLVLIKRFNISLLVPITLAITLNIVWAVFKGDL
jgi:hypothetical protein